VPAFIDIDHDDVELETSGAQELRTPGRCGGEHDAHRRNDKIERAMRPLNQAMHGAVIELLRSAPLSPGKVGFAWRAAVGPAMERAAAVRLDGRVLVVDAASAQWTREITRASSVILTRLQTYLGADAVERLEVRRP